MSVIYLETVLARALLHIYLPDASTALAGTSIPVIDPSLTVAPKELFAVKTHILQ